MGTRTRRLSSLACAVALLTGASCSLASSETAEPSATASAANARATSTAKAPEHLELDVVSSRAAWVTGGDAVVRVGLPTGLTPDATTVTAEATGKTFPVTTDRVGNTVAKVSGLPDGRSTITASGNGERASIEVISHPTTGPLFSGPQLPMPVCSTELYGLGAPVDDQCSAPTTVRWSYVDTAGQRRPLDDPTQRPADVATIGGTKMPFIVREETGTLDRGIYWITVLDPEPDPDTQQWNPSAWNGRLVYEFGGGCGTSYTQGFKLLGQPDLHLLERGYAFATSTLDTFQVMCNDVLSAEALSMVKERFVEGYGHPEFTIGSGGSGGAIQQYLIAQNYPGLLDAVAAALPFPDALSISPGVVDCALLQRFYASPEGAQLTEAQRTAINGHLTDRTCGLWDATFAPVIDPSSGCTLDALAAAGDLVGGLPPGGLPAMDGADIYDAETNPDGLRCTMQDTNVNIYGTDPATGFARRPWDNTGVQYGLAALEDGAITMDEFLDLNEHIGSFDIDGNAVAARAEADEDTLRTAYETGRIIDGSGDLRRIPIITINVWTDDQGDIHDRFRAFTVRDRLALEDGTDPPNHMIWTRGVPEGGNLVQSLTGSLAVGSEAVTVLDAWLTALGTDTSDDDLDVRLARARPAEAVDNCITADGTRVSGLDLYEQPGPCTDPFPLHGDPRTVAGAPRRNDILKCQLQPVATAIDEGTYPVPLSDEQRGRLETIFPDGVCDYTQPGVGQVPVAGAWLTYPR